MGALKTYNPKEVDVLWDGIDMTDGIIEGTFVTIVRNERSFELNVGGDGGGTKIENNNDSVVVAVTLRKGSSTNTLLSNRAKGLVAPIMVKDNNGDTLHQGPQAFLDGQPDDEFETGESEITWTLIVHAMDMNVGGSSEA